MNTSVKWHRHLGIYGVCLRPDTNELLVIRKSSGPYQGRYDLPGGSIKPQESLLNALHREFREETGYDIEIQRNLGTYDFLVKVPHKDTTHTHHVALFYQVNLLNQTSEHTPHPIEQVLQTEAGMERNDSSGFEWVHPHKLSDRECSPLVQKIREWLHSGEFANQLVTYADWEVLDNG